MTFTQKDLLHCTNLIAALKKAKIEMDGMEILAMASALQWIGGLHSTIKDQVEKGQVLSKAFTSAPPVPVQSPVVEEQTVAVSEEKPKKRGKK